MPGPGSGRRPRLLVIQSWISYRGAEHISVEIAHLCEARHGWDVRLLAAFVDTERLPPHGEAVRYVLPPKPLVALLRSSSLAYLLLAPALLTVLALVHGRDADVINPHNPPCEVAAAFARLAWRRPVVWVCNGLPPRLSWKEARDPVEWLTWRLARSPLTRWAARSASRIVSASERVAGDVQRAYGSPSLPVHQAIDPAYFEHGDREQGRRMLGLADEEGPVLTLVGQLHARKAQAVVIDALPALVQRWPGLRLVLCGTGPEEAAYRDRCRRLGVDRQVRFCGYIERPRLAHIYAAADLNLVPYWRDEGCPAVPFEALLAGTPSLVAAGCGADELIRRWEAGWIWEPATPIGPAIESALDESLAGGGQEMVARGRRGVREELTWDRYVDSVERVFEEAMA
jgi:glycosyltransferase involved in cell wall biosynthesis